MELSLTGSCACGALAFEATGEPMFQGFCQCVTCRKMSSGHAAAISMNRSDVVITGKFRSYQRRGDSGAIVERNFCPTCSSLVFNSYPDAPGLIALHAAMLDQPEVFTPQMVVYSHDALPWDYIDPAIPRSESTPPARST